MRREYMTLLHDITNRIYWLKWKRDYTNLPIQEQENIDHKMIAPLTGFVVITIIASMIFVYYYFIFEKDSIMKEQYLEAESKILKDYLTLNQLTN